MNQRNNSRLIPNWLKISLGILGLILIFISLFVGFKMGSKGQILDSSLKESTREIIVNEFQEILDSKNLRGSILLFDPSNNSYMSNDFESSGLGSLPASTFKIPNSIILLENDIVKNPSDTIYWDGSKRAFKIWEKDMNFYEAFQKSCLPCYQDLTRKLPMDSMRTWLSRIEYPGMEFDTSNFDKFWVTGDSKISLFDQIDFLERLHTKKLAISNRTYEIMDSIMLLEESEGIRIYAKTGWIFNEEKIRNYGWFVGWRIHDEDVTYFTSRIYPNKNFEMSHFPNARKELIKKVFELYPLTDESLEK